MLHPKKKTGKGKQDSTSPSSMPVRTRAQVRARRQAAAAARSVITVPPVAVAPSACLQRSVSPLHSSPTECAICLDPICCWPHRLACGHAFHATCLQKWGSMQDATGLSGSCPLCREPLHPPAWRTLVGQSGAAWLAWRFLCPA